MPRVKMIEAQTEEVLKPWLLDNRYLRRHPLRGFTGLPRVAHGFADSPVALFRHPSGIQPAKPDAHPAQGSFCRFAVL